MRSVEKMNGNKIPDDVITEFRVSRFCFNVHANVSIEDYEGMNKL